MADIASSLAGSRVLVVGGAGYVGSVLTPHLLAAGATVRVLDAFVWDNAASLVGMADDPRFELVVGDMRDQDVVDRSIRGVDSVVVLAGLVGDPITKKYPRASAAINVEGVSRVIDAALGAGVDRLIFASTCSNYGMHAGDQLADEDSPLSPLSLYAEQKVAIELSLLARAAETPSTVTILRFATAFGLSPRMRLDLTISHFAKDAVKTGRIEIYDADTWRPYCHVADLSEAVRLTLAAQAATTRGQVFNVGSTAENYTKRTLGNLVVSHRPDVELVFREGGSDARNYRVAFDKIQQGLGFSAAFSVADHMPRLISAMESGVIDLDDLAVGRMGNYSLPSAWAADDE